MKKIIFLITSLLLAFLLSSCSIHGEYVTYGTDELANSSDTNKSLHFSLQIDDFYKPFLTHAENEDLKKNFPPKNIKIIAHYYPKIYKNDKSYRTNPLFTKHKTKSGPPDLFSPDFFSLKSILRITYEDTVYVTKTQVAYATNLQFDKNNRIINFDIPESLKKGNLEYFLEGIYLHYPDFSFSNSKSFYVDHDEYVPVFLNRGAKFSNTLHGLDKNSNGYIDRFSHLAYRELDIETDKFERTVKTKLRLVKGGAFNTSVWFSNDKPIKKELLSNEYKNELFDKIKVHRYKDAIDIVIPDSKLSWSNTENTSGAFYKGKTFDVLVLEGNFLKQPANPEYKRKSGIWITQKGDLVSVEHKYDGWECELNYRIIFEKGNQNQTRRYMFNPYNKSKTAFRHNIHSQEKDEDFTSSGKIYITQKNLNIFEKMKQQAKEYYDNKFKELNEDFEDFKHTKHTKKDGPEYVSKITNFYQSEILENQDLAQACMREIDHMKRLMTMPKEHLMQEFEQYKKIINEETSKQR